MSRLRAPRIVVDERERNSGIPEFLRQAGAAIEFAQLKVGDYIVSSETAVERKTVFDLVNSIYDGRLFLQCSELARHYKQPLVLIQGNIAELARVPPELDGDVKDNERLKKKIKRFADRLPLAFDSLAEVVLKYHIPVLHVSSSEQTAQLLISLVNQSLKDGLLEGPLLRKIRKENPLRIQQLSVLASVPGIGGKLAIRMLDRFATPQNALNASAAELASIPGFGLTRALRVRKILDTEDRKDERAFGSSFRQNKLFTPDQ